ncbi:hypothetical protein [Lysobacter gummosus]|uniref:hypothetical protein n=1 Tax=Lysobacter gummosus TaxID=262324 RepID=UPI00362CC482
MERRRLPTNRDSSRASVLAFPVVPVQRSAWGATAAGFVSVLWCMVLSIYCVVMALGRAVTLPPGPLLCFAPENPALFGGVVDSRVNGGVVYELAHLRRSQ